MTARLLRANRRKCRVQGGYAARPGSRRLVLPWQRSFVAMARKRVTDDDRLEAMRLALKGVAADADAHDLARPLAPFHPKNDTFPGELPLELAADALEAV